MKKLLSIAVLMLGLIFVLQSCMEEDFREKPCQVGEEASTGKAGDKAQSFENTALYDLVVSYKQGGQTIRETIGFVSVSNACGGCEVHVRVNGDCWNFVEGSIWYGTQQDLANFHGNTGEYLLTDNGRFGLDFSFPYDPSWYCGDKLYFSVLAKVKNNCEDLCAEAIGCNIEEIPSKLPKQVQMKVKYPYNGAPSLFLTTTSGNTVLDGVYNGWCIDNDKVINENTLYNAKVYSTYGSFPANTVERPENFDLINWIINQGFVGRTSTAGGKFTYGDVQRAIWELIEDQQSSNGLGSWSQARANEIIAAARANGEGFVPQCGQYIAIILYPFNNNGSNNAQITIIQLLLNETECIFPARGIESNTTEQFIFEYEIECK